MGRPLCLVVVGLSWPPETFVALKLRRLTRRGLDVRVGSFMAAGATSGEIPGLRLEPLAHLGEHGGALPGVARDWAELAVRDWRHLRFLLGAGGRSLRRRLPRPLWRLYLRLARMRADVVHVEWLTVASRCLPLLEVWPGPVVISCHGSELPAGAAVGGRPPAPTLPGLFARADAVHVVSRAKRDEARAHGLDVSRACVIRPAIDTHRFAVAPTDRHDEASFRVISVGWLRWLKGYEYAVLAVAELVDQGVPVTLDILGGDPPEDMGERSERARIMGTARDLGVEKRVQLHGNLEPADVCARLQRADALLHSSLSEGLPNVVLEAMACALPVVATDVGGTREAIDDGVEGFLVAPRDPGAAAAALRSLWRDPALRARMGRAGRARAEAQFTIERQTDQWVELYDRVVGTRSPAAFAERPGDG